MRNYHINFDKLVNQLTPHYLGGRKYILFVQSLLFPLQYVSDKWGRWSHDIYQESAMTTQGILFEHFLNSRFSKYFVNPSDKIEILDTEIKGVTMYWKKVRTKKTHLPFRRRREHNSSTPAFYYKDEKQRYTNIGFIVKCPRIDTGKISLNDFQKQISAFVNRYRLSGKNYVIEYK